jgi:hypothetical protein
MADTRAWPLTIGHVGAGDCRSAAGIVDYPSGLDLAHQYEQVMRTPRARGRLDGCHNSNLVRPGTGVPESSSRYGFRTSTRRLQARLGHHQQARNDYAASGMSKSVAGRVAIVTGVSRRTGIGYAIARDFLELG